MAWLAGLVVAAVVLATWVVLRAKGEKEVLTGVVFALLALMLAPFFVPPRTLPDDFGKSVALISAVTGVLACGISLSRRAYWAIVALPVFGVVGLAVWALWNGPGRLF